MKAKILSLLIICSVCIMGAPANAEEHARQGEERITLDEARKRTDAAAVDWTALIAAVKSAIQKACPLIKSEVPADILKNAPSCKKICDGTLVYPSCMATCIEEIGKDKLPSAVALAITAVEAAQGLLCKACNAPLVGCSASNPKVTAVCGAICCPFLGSEKDGNDCLGKLTPPAKCGEGNYPTTCPNAKALMDL